jgi:hypothetical protein
METKIQKVFFTDGTVKELTNIEPINYIEGEDRADRWKKERIFKKQFKEFDKSLLDFFEDDVIEKYASWNLNMINEDDVDKDEKEIDDFSDKEILEEVSSRKLFGSNNSIITQDFIVRFSKIMDKENQMVLDNLLSDLEEKLKII